MPKTHKIKNKKKLSGVKKGLVRKKLLGLEKQIDKKISQLEDLDDMMRTVGRNARSRVSIDEKIAAATLFAIDNAGRPTDPLDNVRDRMKKQLKKEMNDTKLKEMKKKRNELLKTLKNTYQ